MEISVRFVNPFGLGSQLVPWQCPSWRICCRTPAPRDTGLAGHQPAVPTLSPLSWGYAPGLWLSPLAPIFGPPLPVLCDPGAAPQPTNAPVPAAPPKLGRVAESCTPRAASDPAASSAWFPFHILGFSPASRRPVYYLVFTIDNCLHSLPLSSSFSSP